MDPDMRTKKWYFFKLRLILGVIMLMIAALLRYQAVYGSGGMTLSDDWEVGTLSWDASVAAFLFVFWMIVGPSDQVIVKAKPIESSAIESSTSAGSSGASGDDDADDGGGDGD